MGDIAVATMTWARTPDEAALLHRSLLALASHGVRIAIANRPSMPAFAGALRALPGASVVDVTEPGLIPQVHASLQLAAAFGRRFVCYAEPDKELFFAERMASFVAAADTADAGVVLAARSPDSFATFPPMQRYCEGVINELVAQVTGVIGDYSYGPFLIDRALLPHLDSLAPRLGWGWRHYAFLTAHRQGKRIVHLAGDYPCPDDQRHEDEAERAHRLAQLSQNILGLIA